MSFKIPCGGFKLDEESFSLDKNDVLSIPKPLTYDYMPEGYPSKGIEYVTLMEEQEVTFTKHGGLMGAVSPVILDVKSGDKLTIIWDGVSYDVTVKASEMGGPAGGLVFGNLGLINIEDTEDYPFVYAMFNSKAQWASADTAASHTIKVMRPTVTYTPIDMNFIPKNLNVVFKQESGSAQVNCNVTYNELRDWVERGIPVFAVFIYSVDSQYSICNITKTALLTNMLGFAYYDYYNGTFMSKSFVYKSDGTIEIRTT